MKAQLIESEDEHHWVLLDHRVTQLVIDRDVDSPADVVARWIRGHPTRGAVRVQLVNGATRISTRATPSDCPRASRSWAWACGA